MLVGWEWQSPGGHPHGLGRIGCRGTRLHREARRTLRVRYIRNKRERLAFVCGGGYTPIGLGAMALLRTPWGPSSTASTARSASTGGDVCLVRRAVVM